MSRSRPPSTIVGELIVVALLLGCVGGTLGLILNAYRKARPSPTPPAAPGPIVAAAPTQPEPEPAPKPAPAPKPRPVRTPRPAPPPPEDPTPKLVAGLAAQADRERAAAQEADRKASALAAARAQAEALADRRRRREALVRAQLADLDAKAKRAEDAADEYALERDVLARERDAAKAALEKVKATGGGYAVMPHKGPNGTWQRPVVIECRGNVAVLQPRGKVFTMLDMSPLMGARSSPLVGAVARELMRIEDQVSPDGTPVVPYIYFIVRPDGVRPFYEARGRLEPLGIAFGYELVEQDWEIAFPDLDTWEGAGGAPGAKPGDPDRPYRFPAERGDDPKGDANPFLWPRTPPGGGGQGEGEGDLPGDPDGDRPGLPGGRPGGLDPGRLAGGMPGNGRLPQGGGGVPGRGGAGGGRARGASGNAGPDDGLKELLGSIGSGTLPPEGVDITPLLEAFERVGPEGLRGLLEARRRLGGAAGGTAAEGDVSLPPGRLPDLERLEGIARALGASPAGGRPGGTGDVTPSTAPGVPNPERIPILPEQLEGDPFEGLPPRDRSTGPGLAGAGGAPGSGASGAGGSGAGGSGAGASGAGGSGAGMPGARRSGAVQVPLDLVVACGPDGVTLHPGGYKLSAATLKAGGRLARDLETIVANYRRLDPDIIPRPRLEFLIELGGHETFAEARRQTVLLGNGWPVSIRVAESSTAAGLFGKERF